MSSAIQPDSGFSKPLQLCYYNRLYLSTYTFHSYAVQNLNLSYRVSLLLSLFQPVSPQRSPVSPHPPLLRGDLSMLLRGGTSSGISPSGTSPAGTDATQQDQFQQQHGRMQRSRSSRGTRNGGANNAGGGSQSPRGGATFSSSHKGQSYQQQSFPFPQLNSLPTAGSTTINNIIASPTASAAATAASNTSTTITTTNVTSFLLQQASTKLMGSGGGK